MKKLHRDSTTGRGRLVRNVPANGRFVLALILALLLTAPSTLQAESRDDVIAASDVAISQVHRALKEKDGGLLASVFTSNGTIITSGGRSVQGRGTIRTSAAMLFFTLGSGELTTSRNTVTLVDSVAYETGRYTFTRSGSNNRDESFGGQYVLVWQLEESEWKIATLIGLR